MWYLRGRRERSCHCPPSELRAVTAPSTIPSCLRAPLPAASCQLPTAKHSSSWPRQVPFSSEPHLFFFFVFFFFFFQLQIRELFLRLFPNSPPANPYWPCSVAPRLSLPRRRYTCRVPATIRATIPSRPGTTTHPKLVTAWLGLPRAAPLSSALLYSLKRIRTLLRFPFLAFFRPFLSLPLLFPLLFDFPVALVLCGALPCSSFAAWPCY